MHRVIQQVSDSAGIRVQVQLVPVFVLFSRHKDSFQGTFQAKAQCEVALDRGMGKRGAKFGSFLAGFDSECPPNYPLSYPDLFLGLHSLSLLIQSKK